MNRTEMIERLEQVLARHKAIPMHGTSRPPFSQVELNMAAEWDIGSVLAALKAEQEAPHAMPSDFLRNALNSLGMTKDSSFTITVEETGETVRVLNRADAVAVLNDVLNNLGLTDDPDVLLIDRADVAVLEKLVEKK